MICAHTFISLICKPLIENVLNNLIFKQISITATSLNIKNFMNTWHALLKIVDSVFVNIKSVSTCMCICFSLHIYLCRRPKIRYCEIMGNLSNYIKFIIGSYISQVLKYISINIIDNDIWIYNLTSNPFPAILYPQKPHIKDYLECNILLYYVFKILFQAMQVAEILSDITYWIFIEGAFKKWRLAIRYPNKQTWGNVSFPYLYGC